MWIWNFLFKWLIIFQVDPVTGMVMNIVDLKVFMQVIYICKFSYLEFMYQYNKYFKVTRSSPSGDLLLSRFIFLLAMQRSDCFDCQKWHTQTCTWMGEKMMDQTAIQTQSPWVLVFKVLYTKLCAAGIWTMQSYCHTPPNLKLSLISNFPLTGANLVSSRGWHSTKCNMLEERPG